MNTAEFEAKLNRTYRGNVTALKRYINPKATLLFRCDSCQTDFWGKPAHIVGQIHQRHECGRPYGNSYGDRTLSVGSVRLHKKKEKPRDGEALRAELDLLLMQGEKDNTIRTKLKIDLPIIKSYREEFMKRQGG